ncbi:related to spore coat protein SP96 precursor [Cephalotrichum gorgonifer]|uniref:Related to spore coat protein SP96 n=1 Tax=Cephalotrichum gorgonifer TaxID=2041049 RepID=A0AAE8MRI6_9PEZI|nr:related to spore coat protein SP96 precursor [Cephalotrichum gorgonifer]
MHSTSIISAALGLVASASAHVVMSTPKGWTVNNSPLLADGTDFPCKGVAYDSSVPTNVFNKGESQPLTFMGSAVHGGGSCQISLTTDLAPTKDSKWKVIKSFEGGCPVQNTPGNLGDDANLPVPFDYDFVLPDDVPAGKYTLAWTWFNKIGNREMYMNCAPAEAVGSGGSSSTFDALPDMFVANIGNGCATADSVDLKFPNPGSVVEKLGSGDLVAPIGGSCGASVGGGSGSGSGSGSDGGNYQGGDENESPSTPTQPGAIFATVPSATKPTAAPQVATPAYTEPTPAPVVDTPVVDTPVQETPAAGTPAVEAPANGSEQDGSAGSSGGYAPGTACTSEGNWNCVGGSSFQRCGSGTWSAVQQLAQGTSCSGGESDVIQITRKRGAGKTRFGAKFLL